MNYSTIKKVVAYSMLSVLGLATVNAQTTTSSAKVFGGAAQYRTWSFGVNVGATAPTVIIGGSNDYTDKDLGLGYGISLRKQVNHTFGFIADAMRGTLEGHNKFNGTVAQRDAAFASAGTSRFITKLHYAASLSGIFNFTTVDFLHRDNSLNFFVKSGIGMASYAPFHSTNYDVAGGQAIDGAEIKSERKLFNAAIPSYSRLYIPVGLGFAYKLSDKISLDLGYNMNFVDADNLDGYAGKFSKDKWSYGYAGLDFSLGDASKPNLDWVNPVALMYDELKDPTLRQEVEALKGRVSTLENTVNQLSADADGDGVSNKFDKCPGTPAGSVVDGSGCPIKFPAPQVMTAPNTVYPMSYASIMFEFDSSVLKTSSYPILDQLSADLRANAGEAVTLSGYASSEGTDAYNMRLSLDRANSVKSYLVNSGVDASRVTANGLGEANPVASNSTEEGRVQNRRVEIKK